MIELVHFSKSYHSSPAVHDVSLHCASGRITGLLGENGAGKTTILRAVCAEHIATSGQVLVNGIDAAENPAAVRSLVGFVPEQANLPSEYTVRELLSMTAHLHGVQNVQKELSRVSELCAIGDVLGKKIHALSKGYRERVAFARALIFNPPVLVLDEPASGLDPAQIVRMRALVSSLAPSHTILLSTHLMQEVDALCDEICILHKGRSVAQGTAQEIAREAGTNTLEEAFFKLTQGENPLENAQSGESQQGESQ